MRRLLVVVLSIAVACTNAPKSKISTMPGASSIQGVVTEGSGVPLPGVTVTAKDTRGGTRSVVTDVEGRYAIDGVAPGRYLVTAELPGFRITKETVEVAPNRITMLELMLSLSSVTETITVTAASPAFYAFDSMTEVSAARPQYAQFADHGFTSTKKERVTTFAIDVDRASYANVRRFLMTDEVPPPDAVRVEEMINYFTYDYPQPSGEHPFSITTEVAGCPWNANNRLLRIGIQGRNLEQWKMAPNNLVFLIDVSGSMSGDDRLQLVKQAFHVLIDQLRAEDRVAVVVYAGSEGLALPSTSGADKDAIRAAIDNLGAGGSTAGAAGIELAYKIAKENFLPSGNNRVILATDGDFNVGISDIPELEKLIEKKRESGIFLSTIGVGDDNFQDALMEMLADKGNGNYAYLDTLKEAEKVFKNELTGTLVTIAKDVKVQLDFDPALVASYRQIGYENRAMANKDFDDDTKDAGELGAGHSVTALYEIVPRGSSRGAIASIKLRYKEPDGTVSKLVEASAVDEGKSAFESSPDQQFAAAVAEMGMLLRNSPHKGNASWDDVAQLVRTSRGVDLDGLRGEFGQLVETAKRQIVIDRLAASQ